MQLRIQNNQFQHKNWQFWKSRLLWIPRNVKIWVPSLILVTHTHAHTHAHTHTHTHTHTKFQHLVIVLPRDMEWLIFSSMTYARTYARTNIIPVGRKCSFGAIKDSLGDYLLRKTTLTLLGILSGQLILPLCAKDPISGPEVCAAAGSKGRTRLDLS